MPKQQAGNHKLVDILERRRSDGENVKIKSRKIVPYTDCSNEQNTHRWIYNIQECAKGGGILLYVSNNLESNYCSKLNIPTFNDSIWCIVNLHKNIKLLVGVCY